MGSLFATTAPTDTDFRRFETSSIDLPGRVTLRRLIWLYFWLLIFEGALRKWILPGFSNPLLLVRDPVVILIYISAGMAGVFPRNGFVAFTAILGVVAVVQSELLGTGNLLVTLYGFRTSFLHLPLIFVIPQAFDRKDFEKLSAWHLIVTIPMFVLVLAQFRASPDSWINNGAAGAVGAQLDVGFGKIRPPGTFSFTSGLVSFIAAAASIAIYTHMRKGVVHRHLAAGALLAITGTVLISGSRGALGCITLILLGVAWVAVRKPELAGGVIRTILVFGVIYFVLASWSVFHTGLEIHRSRIENGGGLKDGIVMRILGGFAEPFTAALDARFFGAGLGMGTNGASSFLYGQILFSLGEGDWDRTVREMGPILGFLHIGLRISLVVYLGRRASQSLERENPLPILLFAAVAPELLNGQFGVPALLGLAVFKSGLCLASTVLDSVTSTTPLEAAPVTPDFPMPISRGFNGRSAYAEQLHGAIEDPATERYGP